MAACNNSGSDNEVVEEYDSVVSEKIYIDSSLVHNTDTLEFSQQVKPDSNNSFRRISVTRIQPDSFIVKGQARIFEAVVEWVIEDGHSELYKGYKTASIGAPEWGDFIIHVKAPKREQNTRLHMILFYSSPKDGMRADELPVYLY